MKTAIIGTGRIAIKLEDDQLRPKPCTHLGALIELNKNQEKFQLIGICDLNSDHSMAAAGKFSSLQIAPVINKSYKKIIDLNPELLIIASTTNSHYEILMHAMEKKIPNIVCEKPICLNREQALKIHEKAIKQGTQIWINYERRFHKKYIDLKSCIESREPYGKILSYTGQLFSSLSKFHRSKNDEGVLLHDTTHLLDLAYFLFGSPFKNNNDLIPKETIPITENTATHTMLISHNKSLNGVIRTIIGVPYFHFEMELIFEEARIRVGNGFYCVEVGEQSPLYEGFFSLKKPKYINKEPKSVLDNPFMKLYNDVYGNVYDPSGLKDACQNVMHLSINSHGL